jgi:hypothetical protein
VETVHVAGIIADPLSSAATRRLTRLLDFLGIAWETLPHNSDLPARRSRGMARAYESILAPLTAVADLWQAHDSLPARSFFFYATEDERMSSEALGVLTGCKEDALLSLEGKSIDAAVSEDWPALTGPMHGLKSTVIGRPCDRIAVTKRSGLISNIISTELGSFFLYCENGHSRAFVSCSSEIVDLDQPLNGKGYDVREQFLSSVPLLMYLKWAFRDVCWQANDSGACLILDDPVLRTKYGFCDFHLLDAQMQQHTFTTNISMIPWNRRRTSAEMASLIKDSEGRLSVSVHGCDHTAGEFGIDKADELNAKVDSADRRMEQHRQTTGIVHDPIMVFPQGIFSRASMRTLQQHQFAAAVNTEALPLRRQEEILTIRDTWALAITRYGSFPLFTRRYPADGLENFAFDLLLGKPCLIIEHHVFFKGEHQAVVRFANTLNALKTKLHWRSLGDVIRRSYQWRLAPDRVVHIRMFANELLLKNGDGAERQYRVEKADTGSVGVKEVTANGRSLEWQTDGNFIVFSCKIPSGAEVLIRVRYNPPETTNGRRKDALSGFVRIAARRYLSEFRDNFLSRHDSLIAIAQKAKRIVSRD